MIDQPKDGSRRVRLTGGSHDGIVLRVYPDKLGRGYLLINRDKSEEYVYAIPPVWPATFEYAGDTHTLPAQGDDIARIAA